MNSKQAFFSLFAVITVIPLLIACSPTKQAPATVSPDATPIPESTPAPTETPTYTPDVLVIPPEAVDWLQVHAVPFDTAEPGHGCTDLQPLLEMIGDARIVALGEPTHGTHEFFAMKHRTLECLVTEKGLEALEFKVALGPANRDLAGTKFPYDKGIAGYVFMTGMPIATSNVREDKRFNQDFAESTGYVPNSILATSVDLR